MSDQPFEMEIACPRCGERFTCRPEGPCWCRDESFRLPLPAAGYAASCYCPGCLKQVAAEALAQGAA